MNKIRTGLVSAAVLLALGSPAWSQAPAKAWDPKALTPLVHRFVAETKHIQESVGLHVEEAAPDSPRRIVLNDVYSIHHRAVSLETALRAGQGRDETEPVFRRLVDGVKNARQDAKRFPEIEKARRHIDKADELLKEMAGYYAVGS
jgi:hypothetical protein